MKKIEIFDIKTMCDPQLGSLSVFEGEKDSAVPFLFKRIYYIYGVPEQGQRGCHAHKKLQQILFCPYGEIAIQLDDGNEKQEVILDSPNKGLFIGSGIWREMKWLKKNSVLCVAASDYYDESDYIRQYEDFIALKKEGYWHEN